MSAKNAVTAKEVEGCSMHGTKRAIISVLDEKSGEEESGDEVDKKLQMLLQEKKFMVISLKKM